MEERVERRRGSVCASVKQNNQRMTQERAIVKQDCAIHTLTSALTFVIAWYWICLKSPYHYGISTLPGLAEQGWSWSLALCRCCAQLLSHPESFQVSRFKSSTSAAVTWQHGHSWRHTALFTFPSAESEDFSAVWFN